MKKHHKKCPMCHRNIIPIGSKKGTICGDCRRRLEAEKASAPETPGDEAARIKKAEEHDKMLGIR